MHDALDKLLAQGRKERIRAVRDHLTHYFPRVSRTHLAQACKRIDGAFLAYARTLIACTYQRDELHVGAHGEVFGAMNDLEQRLRAELTDASSEYQAAVGRAHTGEERKAARREYQKRKSAVALNAYFHDVDLDRRFPIHDKTFPYWPPDNRKAGVGRDWYRTAHGARAELCQTLIDVGRGLCGASGTRLSKVELYLVVISDLWCGVYKPPIRGHVSERDPLDSGKNRGDLSDRNFAIAIDREIRQWRRWRDHPLQEK
jgi:hypothetical protein